MAERVSTQAVLVDTSRSPHARLRPVPVSAVKLSDEFWAPRLATLRETTLPSQYRLCEETGRIDNFRRAARKKDVPFQGFYFNDSDVYKWLEAVCWTLATDQDPTLEKLAEGVINDIADAQQPDGYLNTYFTFERAKDRWTNLRDMHELYCAGHLIQAAVTHYRATRKDRLLNVARRLADRICDVFGPEKAGKCPGACGHPEIEMALVELARTTGAAKYLAQAQFFINVRGKGLIGGSESLQDHRPLREMDRMAGHAVRAAYLNAGAADICAETGEVALREALERMWNHMTAKQMYITGGVGSRHTGEAFGRDYELPNEDAYAETCATIANIMWNWRMLALEGSARYADMLETALYNGALSGISLDGLSYFYVNPLASDGSHRRQGWFGCACCPPNIARLLASLPGYFYSVSERAVWVHLYAATSAQIVMPDGVAIEITQRTNYPWDGTVELELKGEGSFSLMLRAPGWCEHGARIEVNGKTLDCAIEPGSYAQVQRSWKPKDVVRIELPMTVRHVESHPHVAENLCRVALMRGPLVYCIEQADNPGIDPRDVLIRSSEELRCSAFHRHDLLSGVTVLQLTAELSPPDESWSNRLYRTASPMWKNQQRRRAAVTAIPYYAWANREPGRMQVWLRAR